MKMTLITQLIVLGGVLLAGGLPAAAQIINLDSGSYTLKNSDNSTVLLTGDLVQFGYFSNGTASQPFAGTFIGLTSSGGSSDTTVIGEETDNGAGDGTFAYTTLNLNLTASQVPANGQIMTFVISNKSSLAASTDYAAEADLATPWAYTPLNMFSFPQSFSLDDPGTWENNIVGYTGISSDDQQSAVPEPQTWALAAVGMALLAVWRQRLPCA